MLLGIRLPKHISAHHDLIRHIRVRFRAAWVPDYVHLGHHVDDVELAAREIVWHPQSAIGVRQVQLKTVVGPGAVFPFARDILPAI